MVYNELKLENQICFRLYTASRLIIQAYTPMLNTLGITYPQYLALMVLWEKSPLPVNTIAKKLLLETNTITPLLQRLEKENLVKRQKSEVDKRCQMVDLTPLGKEMQEKAINLIPSGMAERLSICPLNINDYINLSKELDTIINSLKK